MFRFATLVRVEDGSSLEVHVQRKGFEKKEDARTTARNITGQTSMGSVCFYDDRNSKEILNDFARTYQTPHWTSHNKESFFAEYSRELSIIPPAFVNYFSDERSSRRQ